MSVEPEEVTFESVGATLYGYVWPAQNRDAPASMSVMSHGLTNHHEDAPMFGLLATDLLPMVWAFYVRLLRQRKK